ncbi:MAG: metallophosphoesterase [Pseudomonadales bacterium]|nr:metallophosphoesterase [Pseudomonadales bacterium]
MRLIHLTDLHLTRPPGWRSYRGRSQSGKRYLGYLSWWRRRRHSLRAVWYEELLDVVGHLAADQILVSGDLTQTGTAEEIDAALPWIQRLGTPEQVLVVPGNHDVYAAESMARVQARWGDYLHLTDSGYPLVRDSAGVRVVGLCSARPTQPFSATGRLGERQCERLDALLAQPADAVRVVLLHHPPVPGLVGARKRLQDADVLADILARRGVELVLHGHQHRNREVVVGATRILCTGPASSADASFRVFDIESDQGNPRVSAELWQRVGAGDFRRMDTGIWTFSAPG